MRIQLDSFKSFDHYKFFNYLQEHKQDFAKKEASFKN